MKKISFIFIFLIAIWIKTSGQTFNSTSGGNIPDNSIAFTNFLINVSGVAPITSSYGLTEVKININHTYVGDLEIYLESPNGIRTALATFCGGSGRNFTNTVFSLSAPNSIANAVNSSAPFSGTYLPTSSFGAQNNGQNPTGNWKLLIRDYNDGLSTNNNGGTLVNWQITFGASAPVTPPSQPACSSLSSAGHSCALATPVCSFNGYCGNTSSGVSSWTDLDLAFCGGIQNNSFVKFVAAATSAVFNVWVYNSVQTSTTVTKGLQMMFFSTSNCGSGSVNNFACYHNIPPGTYPSIIQASGLTIGNTYYLMFDGYGGDACDYTITPISGVQTVVITGTTSSGSTSNSICSGESITLTPSGLTGPFTWTGPGLPINGIVSPSITVSPTTTTTYTVSSPDPNNSCAVAGTITSTFTVTVNSLPVTPVLSATSIKICDGDQSPNLTTYVSSAGPFNWYTNTFSPGNGQSTVPIINTDITSHNTALYYVTQTTATCGESSPSLITIDLYPKPMAPASVSDFSICSSSLPINATLSVSPATGTNVNWYSTSTSGVLLSPTPSNNFNTSINAYSNLQTFYAEAIDPISSCVSDIRTPVTAIVNEIPHVLPPIINQVLCSNTEPVTMNITATTNNSDNLVNWYDVPVGGAILSSSLSFNASVNFGTKDFYLEISDPSTNCVSSSRAHFTATLNRNPDLPVLSPDISECRTTPGLVTLSASSNNPGNEIIWYDSPSSASSIANGSINTYSVSNFGTDTLFVEVKDPITNCISTPRVPLTFSINEIPEAPLFDPISSCVKNLSISPLSAPASDETLMWYNVNHQLLGSGNSYNVSFQTPGNYILYADILNDSTGCKSSSTNVNILIKHALDLGQDLTKKICIGKSIDLNTIFPSSAYNSTLWTLGGVTVPDITNITQPGLYQLDASNFDDCTDQTIVNVLISDPVPASAGNDTIAVYGQPHQLIGFGGIAFEWRSTSLQSNFISNTQKPFVTLFNDQLFILKVTDENGCIGEDSVFVKVLSGPEYHAPNAFTPNGDGLNDVFRVFPSGIAYTEWFKIYNRNGNLVFQSNKWLYGWDGKFQGTPQPTGTYVWVIRGLDKNGRIIEKKGTVILIR